MAINFLGTWEPKENKTRNTGTKAYFRDQETPKWNKYSQGTREHKGNLVENKGTWTWAALIERWGGGSAGHLRDYESVPTNCYRL